MSQEQKTKRIEYANAKKKAVYSLIANSPKGVNFNTMREIFGLETDPERKRLRSTLKNLKEDKHVRLDTRSRRYFATRPTSPLMVVRAHFTDNGIELSPVRWVMSQATKPFMVVKKSDTEYKNIQDGDKLLVAIQSTNTMTIGKKRKPVSICAVISKIDSNAPVEIRAIFKRSASGEAGLVPAFRATKGVYTPIHVDGYEGPYNDPDYPDNATVNVRINETKSQHQIKAVVTDLAAWKSEYPASLLSKRDKANGLFRDTPYTQAEEAEASNIAARAPIPKTYKDMRHVIQFAVDPVDAKDHDDAISALPDPSPDNKGGWVITVSDIDVVRLITQMKRASDNALEHPLSAYTNDSVIHMLPKSWAEEAASLKDRQERFCISAQIRITAEGEKLDHDIFRSLNAPHQVSYQDVDAILDGQAPQRFSPAMLEQIENLAGAYEALVIEDINRGALNFEQPRTLIEKDNEGRIKGIHAENGSIARDIIKKFMVLANRTFREECAIIGASTIDRIEEEPNIQNRLPKKIAPTNKEALFLNREWSREEIRSTLDAVSDNPALHQATSDLLIRRVMRPGKFTTEEIGHFGLALDDEPYAPFNSPVRSLADLSNMMSLFDAKGWLLDYTTPMKREWLHENIFGSLAQRRIAENLNHLQPQYKALQRNATRRQAIAYLNRYQGQNIDATIQHVTDSDICLKLADCAYSFTFPLQSFAGGVYSTDTEKQCVIQNANNHIFPAGSALSLNLSKADPITQQIHLGVIPPKKKPDKAAATLKEAKGERSIIMEAEILQATTKCIKVKIGNKVFDLTNTLRGSKSLRANGLYHYNTGQTLQTGQIKHFKLEIDEKSRIVDCHPTYRGFSPKTKLRDRFMKDHGIKINENKVIQPSQKRQWQGLEALANHAHLLSRDGAE